MLFISNVGMRIIDSIVCSDFYIDIVSTDLPFKGGTFTRHIKATSNIV